MIEAVEEALCLPVDLNVVNMVDPECRILLDAFEHGVLMYIDRGESVSELVRLTLLCWDYTVMERRVGCTKLLVRSVPVVASLHERLSRTGIADP